MMQCPQPVKIGGLLWLLKKNCLSRPAFETFHKTNTTPRKFKSCLTMLIPQMEQGILDLRAPCFELNFIFQLIIRECFIFFSSHWLEIFRVCLSQVAQCNKQWFLQLHWYYIFYTACLLLWKIWTLKILIDLNFQNIYTEIYRLSNFSLFLVPENK